MKKLPIIVTLLLSAPAFADETYPRVVPAKDAAEVLGVLLGTKPRVLAVGEQHQTTKTAKIPSAIMRFTEEFLPLLSSMGATDLVVETWISTGKCGEEEKQAVAEVEKTTERPKNTENEVITLVLQAKDRGLVPWALEMDCKDYQALLQSGRTDFDKLLRLTGDQLRLKITKALAHPKSRLVVSYGGALHNDLHPDGESAPYSFAPAVSAQVGGALVELDLYVPEYIGKDNPARKAAWYALAAKKKGLTLVERNPGSFVLLFPRKK